MLIFLPRCQSVSKPPGGCLQLLQKKVFGIKSVSFALPLHEGRKNHYSKQTLNIFIVWLSNLYKIVFS